MLRPGVGPEPEGAAVFASGGTRAAPERDQPPGAETAAGPRRTGDDPGRALPAPGGSGAGDAPRRRPHPGRRDREAVRRAAEGPGGGRLLLMTGRSYERPGGAIPE